MKQSTETIHGLLTILAGVIDAPAIVRVCGDNHVVVTSEARNLILNYYPSKGSYNFQGSAVAKDPSRQKARQGSPAEAMTEYNSLFKEMYTGVPDESFQDAVHEAEQQVDAELRNLPHQPELVETRKIPVTSNDEIGHSPMRPSVILGGDNVCEAPHTFVIRKSNDARLFLSTYQREDGGHQVFCWRTQLRRAIQFCRAADARLIGSMQDEETETFDISGVADNRC